MTPGDEVMPSQETDDNMRKMDEKLDKMGQLEKLVWPERRLSQRYEKLEDEELTDPRWESSRDVVRTEEPWGVPQETLIRSWRDACQDLAARHDRMGQFTKKKHHLFGLPAMLIPMVMAPMSSAFQGEWFIGFVEMTGFMCTALASGMTQFFNFGAKAEKHFQFSARYADLVTDIDQELAKPRSYRQQVDTFSLRTKMMYDALNRGAPCLPS